MATEPVRYPSAIVPVGHVEPVPRRVRGLVGGRAVFDTRRALYVWEWPPYPQYTVPLDDLAEGVALSAEGETRTLGAWQARRHALRVGSEVREAAAWVWDDGAPAWVRGTVRFEWEAVDGWWEEDEPVFVHPRSPYSRVDALRSSSRVRVALNGEPLADAPHCVTLFETGLPTRYYLDRAYVDWTRLVPSDTVTRCPYKGTTSGYWSLRSAPDAHPDILWAYDFPTPAVHRIAGMVAFYGEQVDLLVDGAPV
ncbi:DUF427 domain-containing protein [Streptomyces parvulus]|uniref:DUF427 domain-containing protein n=1 Tax=Streptomyces parvulus TaxID=146923 RepID=UPI0037FD31E5